MKVYPNCKINLGLQVVRRREDGYHDLQSVFLPVGLTDELEVARMSGMSGILLHESGLTLDSDFEQHMLVKAYWLMEREYGVGPVEVWFKKNIPFGAGLGGGSADAAYMLMELNRLFRLNLSPETLATHAKELGADCPFFIYNEPMYVQGIGDRLSPLKIDLKGTWLVLVKPDIHVSTTEAYRYVQPRVPEASVREIVEKYPLAAWEGRLHNDFEDSVFPQHPGIKVLKDNLKALGAIYTSMSGSGSTVYGFFRQKPNFGPELQKNFIFVQKLS